MESNKNLAASVKSRLQNYSKQHGAEFQYVLIRYGGERILYRLSRSDHKNKFLLKGAALFALWFNEPHRPTKDVDLLGFGESNIPALEEMFKEICAIQSEDGLDFLANTVKGERIRAQEAYQGVRLKITAMLEKARIPVQIDVGFGDAVTPAARSETLPTILGLPAPEMKVYPKETVVAEKFEALVKLGLGNGRMKDFWDLDYLIRNLDFEGVVLQKAISATFRNRQTTFPKELPTALTNEFTDNTQVRSLWNGFISRNRIETRVKLDEVITDLRVFFTPLIEAESLGRNFSSKWTAGESWS